MTSSLHMLTGLPAWATDAEVKEAAEALGIHAQAEGVSKAAIAAAEKRREDAAFAARSLWVRAELARRERAFPAMRTMAEQAKKMEEQAVTDPVILAALHGERSSLGPAQRVVAEGRGIPPEMAEQAKASVLAAINTSARR